jgi:ferredoxin
MSGQVAVIDLEKCTACGTCEAVEAPPPVSNALAPGFT